MTNPSQRDVRAELDADDGFLPTSWIPKVGDLLVSELIRYDTGPTGLYGTEPIAVRGHAHQPRRVRRTFSRRRVNQRPAFIQLNTTTSCSCKPTSTYVKRRSTVQRRGVASRVGSLRGLTATIRAGAPIVIPPSPVIVPELDRLACPLTRNAARCW